MSGVRRYQNPEVYERLAAEYVLGTLRGPARQRFEALLRRHRFLRFAVDDWREKFGAMVELLPPVEPPASVLEGVRQEMAVTRAAQRASPRPPVLQRLGFWRGATVLATLLLLVSAVVPRLVTKMPMPTYVAVLETDSNIPMMVTLGDRRSGMVTVRFTEMPQVGPDQDLQLWAIHRTTQQVMPVAVVPRETMEVQFKLSRAEWQRTIRDTEMFALSLEPKGGSPTAAPSGPILYKGRCLEFI